MKLISALLSLTLVAALSVWLWLSQGPADTEAMGVDLRGEVAAAASDNPAPLAGDQPRTEPAETGVGTSRISERYSAAFVGLQASMDVWRTQPASVLADRELLASALAQARSDAEAELADHLAQQAAEAEQAKKDADSTPAPPKAVAPAPVTPPCSDWDEDDNECDDDDWDDDDEDDEEWDDD